MTAVLLALALASPAPAAVVIAPGAAAAGRSLPVLPAASIGANFEPSLPPFLSVANPEDRVLLAQIVAAAQASPTALKVLDRVAAATAERGRPLVVEIVKMKESGTYNLDWGIISLRRKDLAEGPKANVSTIIHEMLHLLQTDLPVPSDLLETELEAYVVDFRVARELGVTPRKGSYDARAQAAFKEGLEPFMAFLKKEYPEDASFWRTRSRDYRARLEAGLAKSTLKRGELDAARAERLRVLEQMRGLGHSDAELSAYRADAVSPLDAAIETMDRAIEWARRDLAVFASPESLAKARAYARAVVRKARRFRKIFAR